MSAFNIDLDKIRKAQEELEKYDRVRSEIDKVRKAQRIVSGSLNGSLFDQIKRIKNSPLFKETILLRDVLAHEAQRKLVDISPLRKTLQDELARAMKPLLDIRKAAPLQEEISKAMRVAQEVLKFSGLERKTFARSLQDVFLAIEYGPQSGRFQDSFLEGYQLGLNDIERSVEKEDFSNAVDKTLNLVEALSQKADQLPDNSFNRKDIINLALAILMFAYQLWDSSQMENRLAHQIVQVQEKIDQAQVQMARLLEENSRKSNSLPVRVVLRRATIKAHPRKSVTIDLAYPNQKVEVVKTQSKWLYVQYFDYIDGVPRSGWILKKYTKEIASQ